MTPPLDTGTDPRPTITHDDVMRPSIAVRSPLPDRVMAYIETGHHPHRGSCLIVRYKDEDKDALIDTLERTIDAIRRGPR